MIHMIRAMIHTVIPTVIHTVIHVCVLLPFSSLGALVVHTISLPEAFDSEYRVQCVCTRVCVCVCVCVFERDRMSIQNKF
jgi:glycerol-3-phosphate acyltransferase PlsY